MSRFLSSLCNMTRLNHIRICQHTGCSAGFDGSPSVNLHSLSSGVCSVFKSTLTDWFLKRTNQTNWEESCWIVNYCNLPYYIGTKKQITHCYGIFPVFLFFHTKHSISCGFSAAQDFTGLRNTTKPKHFSPYRGITMGAVRPFYMVIQRCGERVRCARLWDWLCPTCSFSLSK